MPLVDDGFEALLEPFYNGKKLTDPISTKEDKFQLLPAFLKVKGKGATPSSSSPHANIPRPCEAVCTDSPLACAETSRYRWLTQIKAH
ncbi:DNA-directed RNA polymerase III subunit-like protein [Ilyonectria robusta]